MSKLGSAAIGAGVTGATAGVLYYKTRGVTGDGAMGAIPYVMATYASPIVSGVALTLFRGWRDGLAGAAGGGAVLLGMTLYQKYLKGAGTQTLPTVTP